MQAGRAALGRGEVAEAAAWLERALRYAPDNPEATLSLAAARFAAGAFAEAAAGFRAVAQGWDVREAWLGEAIACQRLGQTVAAAAALASCLSRHRWDGDGAVPAQVAAAAGLAGWCALARDGTVAMGLLRPGACRIEVDGAAFRSDEVVAWSACRIDVTLDGVALLGSPLDAARIHRVEGAVAARRGDLEGWAWHPGDANRDPVLSLADGSGHCLLVTAGDQTMTAPSPLSRPRRFSVAASELAGFTGPIAVTGSDGRDLAGSPLDPDLPRRGAAELALRLAAAWPLAGDAAALDSVTRTATMPAGLVGPPPAVPLCRDRPVAVVVPAYRGLPETMACLDALRRTLPPDSAVLVVDDASPEPELAAALDRQAASGAIRLLRLPHNRGFPGAANAGLRQAALLPGRRDLVLLNSDTLPTAGWLERLRAAVHGAPDVGTATPLSNDATILSYPDPQRPRPPPVGPALALLARQAARANPATVIDIPTAVGFNMYIRRECIEQVGVFREDAFAQGYGEENDFCLRATKLGWRHVTVPGAYVAHLGGRSFGAARAALLARNMALLEQLHPGYHTMIAAWVARDPLHEARRRLDVLRWRALGRSGAGGTVLLVTHDSGGGVERCVQDRVADIRASGFRPLLLRPVLDRSGEAAALERRYRPGLCRIDEPGQALPNLTFRVADELAMLASLLRAVRPRRMEVHHLLGHDHAVLDLARRLAIPYEVRLHDYAWFCPRISLLGAGERYCGEPAPAGCVACVADLGSKLEESIAVPALIARSAADFAGATRVVAPSRDAAERLARHFPAIRPTIEPHEVDIYGPLQPTASAALRTICVVGAIGPEKGYGVLLACARDSAARRLGLAFVVVGHTVDDDRLLDTGRVRITGPFAAEDAVALIRAQRAAAGFIPSVWPETWCLALGEVWRAGLGAVAFDLGAPAERIRATGRGWLLPLGLPAARVNQALLTLAPLAENGLVMQTG